MKRTFPLLLIVICLMITSSTALAARIPDEASLTPATPNGCAPPLPEKTADDLEWDLMLAVNQFRAQNGLPPWAYSQLLRNSARAHSQDMSQNNFFSHIGSNGSTADQRIRAAGYDWFVNGEDLAAGQNNAAQIVAQWAASPTHRAVMSRVDIREIGIGYVYDPNDQANVDLGGGQHGGPFCFYWTLNVGSRLGFDPVITFSVVPREVIFLASKADNILTPSSAELHVQTVGGAISWLISANQPWLILTPHAGGDLVTLQVQNWQSMGQGSYSANITVSAVGISDSPQVVPVQLVVSNQRLHWGYLPYIP